MQNILPGSQLAVAHNIVGVLSGLGFCYLIYLIRLTKLMKFSSVGMTITALLAVVFYVIAADEYDDSRRISLSSYVSQIILIIDFLIYTAFTYASIADGVWILPLRLFPTIVTSTILGILDLTDLFWSTVLLYFMPTVIYGRYFTFLFLAFVGSSAFIFCLLLQLPEKDCCWESICVFD